MIKDVNHRFSLNVQNIDKKQPRSTQISERIIQRQQIRQREDVGDWRDALSLAESAEHPDRTRLIKIYKDIDLDGHISGIISSINTSTASAIVPLSTKSISSSLSTTSHSALP